MSKIAIIYWSMTGNTEAMAQAIEEELKDKAYEVDLIEAGNFTPADVDGYDGFAFGCPAMGDESLEEAEFEPMFSAVEAKLADKPVVIFGSYEWNDGQWMLDWEERCKANNIQLAAGGLAVYDSPSDDDIKACKELAEALAAKF